MKQDGSRESVPAKNACNKKLEFEILCALAEQIGFLRKALFSDKFLKQKPKSGITAIASAKTR